LLITILVLVYAGWIGYVLTRNKPVDFYVYYSGGLAVRQGKNLFDLTLEEWIALGGFPGIADKDVPYPHRYPPFYHVLMVPLTLAPPRTAALLWAVASGLAMLASALLLAKAFPSPYSDLALLALLGLSVPALAAIHAGQVTPFVLLCLAFSLVAWKKGYPVWSGLALGAATLLKVIPIALIAYMVWRKQLRVAAAALLLVALVALVSLPLVGVDDYLSFLRQSSALTRADRLTINPPNQSLGGFIGRFSIFLPADTSTYLWVIQAVSASFVALTILICWPPGDLNDRIPLEFGLIVATLHLVTPFAWHHQLHLLLIPLAVLSQRMLTDRTATGLILPILAVTILTDVHGLFWHQLQAWRPYSIFVSTATYGTLILWGTLAALILARRARPRASVPLSPSTASQEE
jgi:hypothetical protein